MLCAAATQKNDVATMVTLSGLYGKADQPEKELLWTNKILSVQPTNFAALINRGNAYSMLGNIDAARENYKKAGDINPKSPLPEYSLGVLDQSRNMQRESILHFKKALQIAPQFEDAMFNLAVAYANLGMKDQAVAMLNNLISKNPNAQDAIELRAVLISR
jgi:tetratricopeptide (TPR) repeat protein